MAFGSASAKEKQPIKIAILMDRSNVLAFYGDWSIDTFLLGLDYCLADDYNGPWSKDLSDGAEIKGAFHLPDGREIRLKVYDTQGKADVGVAKAEEAIIKWGADILVGCTWSPIASSVTSIAKEYEKLFFVTPAAAASITEDPVFNKYVFRLSRNGVYDAKCFAYYATKTLKAKTFGFLAVDNPFGRAGVANMEAAVGEYGGKTVAAEFAPATCADFKPYIERVLAHNPDAVMQVWAGNFGPLYKDLVVTKAFERTQVCGAAIDILSMNWVDETPGCKDVLIGVEGLCAYGYKIPKNPVNDWLAKAYKDKHVVTNWRLAEALGVTKLKDACYPELYSVGNFATAQAIVKALEDVPGMSTDGMIADLEGMELETPGGRLVIRPEDHQGIREGYIARCVRDNDPSSETYGLIIAELVEKLPPEAIAPPIKTTYKPSKK
jgi:branched-chain amino acid transport system substrate-binding protein